MSTEIIGGAGIGDAFDSNSGGNWTTYTYDPISGNMSEPREISTSEVLEILAKRPEKPRKSLLARVFGR